MCSCRSSGFTLVEMLVTVAVISVLVSMVFINYTTFTSHSNLRVRSDEVVEYIRYAQETSASAQKINTVGSDEVKGFQVVRLKVRDGLLRSIRLETVPGVFSSFASVSGNNFHAARSSTVIAPFASFIQFQEQYFVDACFISINSTGLLKYDREGLLDSGSTCSMLCNEPDPSVSSARATEAGRNNFDVHFSVEQPTREVHANIFPVTVRGGSETYGYSRSEPNGSNARVSGTYVGVRIVLISPAGLKRSIDVYQTGLIDAGMSNSAAGCGP